MPEARSFEFVREFSTIFPYIIPYSTICVLLLNWNTRGFKSGITNIGATKSTNSSILDDESSSPREADLVLDDIASLALPINESYSKKHFVRGI